MSYTLIGHQRLDTAAASITFSNIPQTFTDLQIVYSLRGTGSGANSASISAGVLINGSGGSTRRLLGNGSAASSAAFTTGDLYPGEFTGATSTANTFGNASIYIPNYKSSAAKSISFDAVSENNATEAYQLLIAGLSDSTAPVTSLTIRVYAASANISFAAGSTATLYGINRTQAIGRSPQAVGGHINYANGYWYHAFTGSGNFIPFNNMQVEYLVVAGGGGGGGGNGGYTAGGGGAGGYRSSVIGELSGGGTLAEANLSITAGVSYAVTVGAGGSGGSEGAKGTNGSNSTFATITSTGGGGGGAGLNVTGLNGGSGGGGGTQDTSGFSDGGTGVSAQGFSGGRGRNRDGNSNNLNGGGGGGAGGTGISGNNDGLGFGGSGLTSSITGTAVARGGGGGGGGYSDGTPTGGLGGGGNGGTRLPILNSTPGGVNTGGGGGGGVEANFGIVSSPGGSGVVIVRYRG